MSHESARISATAGNPAARSALMGILDQLYCSGVTVLTVQRLEADAGPEDAAS